MVFIALPMLRDSLISVNINILGVNINNILGVLIYQSYSPLGHLPVFFSLEIEYVVFSINTPSFLNSQLLDY